MTRIKICGITSPEDAQAASAAGADMVGLVFAPSPRRVDTAAAIRIAAALPPFVLRVGVFVDAGYDTLVQTAAAVGLDLLQLHGSEDNTLIERLQRAGHKVVKAVRVKDSSSVEAIGDVAADAVLLDAAAGGRAGGTGQTFDWSLAIRARAILEEGGRRVPLILAGGLRPENVAEALRLVRPDAVDVSSGVEASPGIKSPARMREFVMKVRRFDVETDDVAG